MKIEEIALKEITPLDNIRDKVDKKDLAELAKSIREQGLIHPVTLRKNGKGYQLIAGNRRMLAFELNKETKIPSIVIEAGDDEIKQIQIIENIQRTNLNIIEEAKAIDQMLKDRKCTVKDAALTIGKSEKYVLEHRQLVNLEKKYQDQLLMGRINLETAFRISRLSPLIQKTMDGSYEIDRLESNFVDLKRAPFDVKDKNLLKDVPACGECPYNTGTKKDLFGDMGKSDFCTNISCFRNKIMANVKNVHAKMKASGEEFILITTGYNIDKTDLGEAKPLSDYVSYNPKEHKKLEPVKGLVVIAYGDEILKIGKVLKLVPRFQKVNKKGKEEKVDVAKPAVDPDTRYWRKLDLITFPETEMVVKTAIKELLIPSSLNQPLDKLLDDKTAKLMFGYFLKGIENIGRERLMHFMEIKGDSWRGEDLIAKAVKDFNPIQLVNLMLVALLIKPINYSQPESLATSESIGDLLELAKTKYGWDSAKYRKTISAPYDEQRLKAHTRFVEKHGREPKKK